MQRRHPIATDRLPRVWLMTDERMDDGLWRAVRRLPRGGGIVFRHYATPLAERRRLFARLRRVAIARGLVLVRAGGTAMRGEMGRHGLPRKGSQGGLRSGLVTAPVHDRREATAARRQRADAAFVSPVFTTRSHPGAGTLGVRRAMRLARGLPMVRVALGGVTARRFRTLHGFDGWAAIDAWLGD